MARGAPFLISILFVLGIALAASFSTTPRSLALQRITPTPGPSPTPEPSIAPEPPSTPSATPICPGCRYVPLVQLDLLPTPTPTRDPEQCAAEYPSVCIPPPPPDLNCDDIEFDNFAALPPDRHKFDTDRDGIGCEG